MNGPNGGAKGIPATAAHTRQNLLDNDPLINICKIHPQKESSMFCKKCQRSDVVSCGSEQGFAGIQGK